MNYEEAKARCHARSAIYRTSCGELHWKNDSTPFDERVSVEDKLATDWEEFDPRDHDDYLASVCDD